MYHYIRDTEKTDFPKIHALSVNEFTSQIEWFCENKYKFISAEEFCYILKSRNDFPEKSVLFTFDDGYVDHYDTVMPILEKYNTSGVFAVPGKIIAERKMLSVNKIHFLLASVPIDVIIKEVFAQIDLKRNQYHYTEDNKSLMEKYGVEGKYDDKETVLVKKLLQFVLPSEMREQIIDYLFKKYVSDNEFDFADKLYMNKNQISEMVGKGNIIAMHGYDHFHFDVLTPEEYKSDLIKALDVMSFAYSKNSWIFCYPYGGHNKQLINFCASSGCIGGLTVEPRMIGTAKNDPYRIPRFDCNDFPPKRKEK